MSMCAPIYFLSDSHIRGDSSPAERLKRDRLVSFLRSLPRHTELLYIVGDLFDFWFEYRSVIPRRGAQVVFELYKLVQSGVRVRYLPGNHDPWIGSFFSEDVGVEILSDPLSATHQGRHLYIDHGDLIYSPDRRYRLIRSILR
ncbi:MAG: UDP-2,3-diacylglucosamine diphosphatase, partial [Candidatus Latescibacteria bacterium]|nr:UDP-2,3-diacylglucosamine diphosphatase [Candidatus Latescibacterota bacterium]